MKKAKLILAMIASTIFVFTACEKPTDELSKTVEGKYVGTITVENGLKSSNASTDGGGTADVMLVGDGQLQVHCYGNDIDTTFMLNYYNNNDSLSLCVTGDAFEHMYGHSYQNDMMGRQGGMMGGNQGGMMGGNAGNVDWLNHMTQNHSAGDEHFGGFDMSKNTFGYTIKGEHADYHFQGTKQ